MIIKKRKIIIGFLTILPMVLAWWLFLSDSARINGVIKSTKQGIENRDIEKTLRYVSDGYRDVYGNRYANIKEFFERFFKNSPEINIFVIRKKKDISKNTATVIIRVIINTSSKRYGPVRGQEFIKLGFRKIRKRGWICTSGQILERDPFKVPRGVFTPSQAL
ncbi:MAG: hypothetical protein ABH868_01595 [bacterium]